MLVFDSIVLEADFIAVNVRTHPLRLYIFLKPIERLYPTNLL